MNCNRSSAKQIKTPQNNHRQKIQPVKGKTVGGNIDRLLCNEIYLQIIPQATGFITDYCRDMIHSKHKKRASTWSCSHGRPSTALSENNTRRNTLGSIPQRNLREYVSL